MAAPQITTPSAVRLTYEEALTAAVGGCRRTVSAYENGWSRSDGDPPQWNWLEHIRGALGEMAVCHLFGFTWNANVGVLGAKDAGPYQVRCTAKENGHLLIREKDTGSDDPFILVTGNELDDLDWVVRGWIAGKFAKRDEWRRIKDGRTDKPRITFWVPQSALWPLEDLPPAPARFFRASIVGNIETPNLTVADRAKLAAALATDPEIRLCPVCWGPERIDPTTGRVYPPEHDAHKHAFALARG